MKKTIEMTGSQHRLLTSELERARNLVKQVKMRAEAGLGADAHFLGAALDHLKKAEELLQVEEE